MGFLKFLGALSPAHINFFTLTKRGKRVGVDGLGNIYYSTAPRPGYKHDRRWVMYKGAPEASSVPPEWHGWLHHQTDRVPDDAQNAFRREWQKPPIANLTGTSEAYRPPGHILEGGTRDKATGDYKPWTPPE
ncbi:MAG: NADH:ubiquinone oxidoreductase subunit NDUFA12 [Alphaproteobacteria bacterium]|nr:NADH:ubiquinone oxidoreductase subunit NDUFA12 [Alphaproteobacteria bacterium]